MSGPPAEAAEPVRVFCSHRQVDRDVVAAFARRLRDDGIDAWLDQWEITPGDDFVEKIEEGLQTSRVGLVFLSSSEGPGGRWAHSERRVLSVDEIEARRGAMRRVIPVLIDETAEIPPLLRRLDHRSIDDYDAIRQAILGISTKPPLGSRSTDPTDPSEPGEPGEDRPRRRRTGRRSKRRLVVAGVVLALLMILMVFGVVTRDRGEAASGREDGGASASADDDDRTGTTQRGADGEAPPTTSTHGLGEQSASPGFPGPAVPDDPDGPDGIPPDDPDDPDGPDGTAPGGGATTTTPPAAPEVSIAFTSFDVDEDTGPVIVTGDYLVATYTNDADDPTVTIRVHVKYWWGCENDNLNSATVEHDPQFSNGPAQTTLRFEMICVMSAYTGLEQADVTVTATDPTNRSRTVQKTFTTPPADGNTVR